MVTTYQRVPAGGVPLKQSVSAGTLASIVKILADPDAAIVGRTGGRGLFPAPTTGAALSNPPSLRLRPRILDSRVLATVDPKRSYSTPTDPDRPPAHTRTTLAQCGGRRMLPQAGTGPTGNYLRDWERTVEARATTKQGIIESASLQGSGHPGYTATAALLVEVGLRLARSEPLTGRAGCLTPALAIGVTDAQQLQMPSLRLR